MRKIFRGILQAKCGQARALKVWDENQPWLPPLSDVVFHHRSHPTFAGHFIKPHCIMLWEAHLNVHTWVPPRSIGTDRLKGRAGWKFWVEGRIQDGTPLFQTDI